MRIILFSASPSWTLSPPAASCLTMNSTPNTDMQRLLRNAIGITDELIAANAMSGPKGDPGIAGENGANGQNGSNGVNATIAIGTVTKLSTEATPTVTNSGTSSAAVFDFAIPAGATDPAGTSVTKFSVTVSIVPGTVTLGTVSFTVTATGILSTDSITVQPTVALPAGLTLAHWRVLGNNSVSITLGTSIALGLTLGSNSYSFLITAIR